MQTSSRCTLSSARPRRRPRKKAPTASQGLRLHLHLVLLLEELQSVLSILAVRDEDLRPHLRQLAEPRPMHRASIVNLLQVLRLHRRLENLHHLQVPRNQSFEHHPLSQKLESLPISLLLHRIEREPHRMRRTQVLRHRLDLQRRQFPTKTK